MWPDNDCEIAGYAAVILAVAYKQDTQDAPNMKKFSKEFMEKGVCSTKDIIWYEQSFLCII
jgi:hypothetical protein